jgi:hypothetical protein
MQMKLCIVNYEYYLKTKRVVFFYSFLMITNWSVEICKPKFNSRSARTSLHESY